MEQARVSLTALGAHAVEVVAPGRTRRVVLAEIDRLVNAVGLSGPSEQARMGRAGEEERVAVALRAEGWAAVTRPHGGPRLEAWRRDTAPTTFDSRLTVCFAWSEHPRPEPPALVELGHGGWGSGQHPTTRMLVESMLQRLRGGERVLDVGCGSGVLGLCALRLGAAQVVAVDLQPDAVEATRHNAALNGLAERVDATCAPLASLDSTFD